MARHGWSFECTTRPRATIRFSMPSSTRDKQAGFEVTDDYNGSKQEGFGAMEQTIHKGAAGPRPTPIFARR